MHAVSGAEKPHDRSHTSVRHHPSPDLRGRGRPGLDPRGRRRNRRGGARGRDRDRHGLRGCRRERPPQRRKPRAPGRAGVERPRRGEDRCRRPLEPAGAPGDSLFVIKPTRLHDAGRSRNAVATLLLPACTGRNAGQPRPALRRHRSHGALPDSIDFPLRPQQEPPSSTRCCSPIHSPRPWPKLGYVRDDVVATRRVDAAFGITCGDLMFDDLANYARYKAIVGTIGMPWYNLPGNHDMNFEAPDDTHSRARPSSACSARATARSSMAARRS